MAREARNEFRPRSLFHLVNVEVDRRVEEAYATARAVNAATGGGLDNVIDPAETRTWIVNGLRRVPKPPPRTGKKHAFIDTW